MTGTVHVIGAGLAGLAAAVRLSDSGERVVVHEAARQAGGRCRSYHDATLGLDIDNGNHLLLTGNRAALDFVRRIGGLAALTIADDAQFDFADLATGERWSIRPNAGRIPWWTLDPRRRVPGSRVLDHFAPLAILRAGPDATICEAMRCDGVLFDRLWRPVLLAALNTEPAEASAALAAPVLRETLGAGGAACRPIVATGGLSAAFVEPAVARLRQRGADLRLGTRLRQIEVADGGVSRLRFSDADLEIGRQDKVVLAVPAWVAQDLLPNLSVPTEHRSIVNAHFRCVPPPSLPLVLGLVGGVSEWLFAYPDRLSVTISAGDRLLDTPREKLARQIWAEVARVAGLAVELPPWQIVKERRATFAATPTENRKRPPAQSRYANLVLAGDWTATGLPATIEGSIRSGETAAGLLQAGDIGVSRSVSKA